MINDKVILIIGGSSFLGINLIKKLLQEGYFIIATYNKTKINIKNDNLLTFKLDLIDLKQINLFFGYILKKYYIDSFIFSVSTRKNGLFIDMSMMELDLYYKVNIYSLIYIYKKFLFKYFLVRKNGLLLNISSICSNFNVPFLNIYCGIKSCQKLIINSFDFELSKFCFGFKNIILGPIVFEGNIKNDNYTYTSSPYLTKIYENDIQNFKINYKKKIKCKDIEIVINKIIFILKKRKNINSDIYI